MVLFFRKRTVSSKLRLRLTEAMGVGVVSTGFAAGERRDERRTFSSRCREICCG